MDVCAASSETPLVAVYEPDAGRRGEITAAYPGVLVTDDAGEALGAPGVELAAICAKTGDAVELSKRALAAGKHVVSVKPFARTIAEAESVFSRRRIVGSVFRFVRGNANACIPAPNACAKLSKAVRSARLSRFIRSGMGRFPHRGAGKQAAVIRGGSTRRRFPAARGLTTRFMPLTSPGSRWVARSRTPWARRLVAASLLRYRWKTTARQSSRSRRAT